jgi:asparagine synthase (glutamine-hydrolysing)
VMQLARQKGVKVILDGQGGDELFAGYNTYYTWYLADLAKHLQFGKASKTIRSAAFPGNFRSVAKDYLKLKTLYRLSPSMQLKITKAYFKDISFLNPALGDLYLAEQTANPVKPPHSLNGILHKEFVNTRLKGYLKCEDRCSMWHSVESRTPFADDHPLIEFVFSVPGSYKIHQGKSKYLLRDAVKNYLPPEILGRTDKMGYATPNNKWIAEMKEELRPYFTDTLSPYIQMDKFRAEYDSFFNIQHAPENGRIFKFMVFAIWMKVFNLK